MHTGLEVMKTSIAQQVNIAFFSPPSSVGDHNPATHPDKVEIPAALHIVRF
jgi:hypothetical protein